MDIAEPKIVQIENPLEGFDFEDLDYLELDSIPENVYNPIIDLGLRNDPVEDTVQTFMNPDYLHFTARMLLNVELVPYQLAILDTLWNKRLPIVIGTRGGAKSFILGVYCLLRMILHPGCKIVIVGAGLRQSRQVFDYMMNIWNDSSILRDIAGKGKNAGPKHTVDRYEFGVADSICTAIPLGDGTKVRGLRANYIIADEFASIPPEIFNVVVQGFAVVASSPVQKIKQAARIKKMKKIGVWSEELELAMKSSGDGNQIVYSGTAFYEFNHFAKYWKIWHGIIASKGSVELVKDIFGENEVASKGFNWTDYAIIRLPYNYVPEGLLEPGILAQAKATLSNSQFLMEYAACFPADSDGFYKRSLIESATCNKPILTPNGQQTQFSSAMYGTGNRAYVIGVDPAADQDNAAIVVLEINDMHRRVVYCWTTNRKKYNKYKQKMAEDGISVEDDYYRYIAKKIKSLMGAFNTERIIMDKHGGGTAIAEALASKQNCGEGEFPVYTIIDPEEPKPDDMEEGAHILELLAPTQEINAEANHGMKKDLESKSLIFPLFDTVEIARSIAIDDINETKFDTYEDVVNEIEDLKNEMTTIVITPSSVLGKETFDTPTIKGEGAKKGHLRKDRYSALLYANYYTRNREKQDVIKIEYRAVGGTKNTLDQSKTVKRNENMYYGPGLLKFNKDQMKALKGVGYGFLKR